ncbi:MAG: tRNA (guanosine(18)-2'-O)-methyltransferase TrmH [Gammaproteobacteria bacterium]|nr:tRNA (guanosine(18)-2'-O)-methyltransferase TrmH [Gammaproteobacteria bacterium]
MTPERYATLSTALARRQPDLSVLADNVHKPHNVAALMRSCDAVGVFEIHAVGGAGTFRRAVGISGGTAPWVKVRRHATINDAATELKGIGFQIVAAHFSNTAVDYREPDYTRPTALLLGAELWGVSDEAAALADLHAVLPMRGLVASLNVSVAAALFLYEAARQREAAGMYARCRLPPALYADTLFEWCYPEIAARCREKSIAYPPLTSEGELSSNPFAGSGRAP